MSQRMDKVAHAIQREVQLIIHDELRDPRLGIVTITHVDVAPDLRHAKVHYSVLGRQEEFDKTGKALKSAAPVIRTLVTERINLKFSPELIFIPDHSTEYSFEIQKLLDDVKKREQGDTA